MSGLVEQGPIADPGKTGEFDEWRNKKTYRVRQKSRIQIR